MAEEVSLERTGEAVETVGAALGNPDWYFRTVEGLERETGLPVETIVTILESHPDVARKSVMTNRQGRDLYTKADRRPTVRERLEQVRWILAH